MRKKYLSILIMLSAIGLVQGQNVLLKGTVKTTDGKPVELASVGVKGTHKGTVTDKDGAFEIRDIQPGSYTVFASHVGSTRQELTVELRAGEPTHVDFILNERSVQLASVTVLDSRLNKFYADSAFIIAKLPLKDIENPQVYNSVSRKLLQEQVVTNFNDAIKNATGITRLWESTGRGGDGAEYFSMRGFAVQPTMVNGMPSVNNGGFDPANVETIDVIKGPSGTLFGSPMISYGGLINITTKRPYEMSGGEVGLISGSNGLNRFTADINVPLNEKTFGRVNTAYHTENSFQDAGFNRSIFVAPSFTARPNEKLTFLFNAEFIARESANAPMIFLNRYAPLTHNDMDIFESNYEKSFTSNDLSIKTPSFGLQAQALYKLGEDWTSQTVLSRSNTKTDGYYHYLWDLSGGDTFGRYISKRNGETNTTDIQQNFNGQFKLGTLRNSFIIGIDYFQSNILNSSTGWLGNGEVTLSDAGDTGMLTRAGVDNLLDDSFEGNSNGESKVFSAYVSDVINITPSLSVLAGVRLDRFEGKTAYWIQEDVKSQTSVSPKFGIVYQPLKDRLSVFANYLNGFVNIAPGQVSDLDGSNPRLKTFDPEQADQYEFGVKTNIYKNRISGAASYYNIVVKNRVMTDPNNINNSIQGGEVVSKGFELSLVASPVNGLNIIAGIGENDSEVTKDNPGDGYVGLRPEEAGPGQLINFWASYVVQGGSVRGLGVGIGGNSASEHKTLNRENTGTFILPPYTVFNASLFYTANQYSIVLKLNNVTDRKYFSGWSTVTPQNLRHVSLGLACRF